MISIEIVRCRIPELLFRIGKTQNWLADISGISKQRISAYVNLRVIMTIPVAKQVAFVLKCHIDDLYEFRISGKGRE